MRDTPTFTFDEQSDMPLWVRLRDRVAFLISSGYYKPGEKLPTVRKYAADLHIAYNTVSKAYMGLERDGYVTTVRGSGVFVNDAADAPRASGNADALVEDFVKSCIECGMTYDDVPKLVAKHIRKMKRDHGEK